MSLPRPSEPARGAEPSGAGDVDEAPGAAGAPRALDASYAWFLTGSGSWFGAFGMHQTMVAWLVVGELLASDEVTGVVQMSALLPGLLLLFVGGAVADRVDPRRMLVGAHLLAALPPLALAWGVANGRLTIPYLLVCAVLLGVLNPFAFPSRESMLWHVGHRSLDRAVAGQTMAQFGCQALGMRLAGLASAVGSAPVLVVQAALVAFGSGASARLPAVPPLPTRSRPSVAELLAGFRFVLHTELRWVWILVFGIGLFFGGSYWTLTPLLLREHYGGDVRDLAVLLSTFQVGTLFGAGALLVRGGIRRKGRAMAIALAVGGAAIVVLGQGLPYAFLVATNLVWGLAGSVFMYTSRMLFQSRAPAAERARVLAMNQFGFLAAGPLGALLGGFLSGHLGPQTSLVWMGSAMLLLVGSVLVLSPIARME